MLDIPKWETERKSQSFLESLITVVLLWRTIREQSRSPYAFLKQIILMNV